MPIDHCCEPNGCVMCDGPVTDCVYIEGEDDTPDPDAPPDDPTLPKSATSEGRRSKVRKPEGEVGA